MLSIKSKKIAENIKDKSIDSIKIPQLMIQVGEVLKLPILVISTAIIYYHKFYSKASFNEYNCYIIAQACILLACKAEENIRYTRDIINVFYKIKEDKDFLNKVDDYWLIKSSLYQYEQIILRTFNYDMQISHSHHYLLHMVRKLEGTEELAAISFYILNDSLLTNVSIHYQPHIIACAALYLGAELISEELNNGGEWYTKFGAKKVFIEDICNQILDIYDANDT